MTAIDLSFHNSNDPLTYFSDSLAVGEKRFYLNLSSLVTFKQSLIGPVPLLANGESRLPFLTKYSEDIIKLGTFYSVAIGQGSCYSQGLFGPLPVLSSEYRRTGY